MDKKPSKNLIKKYKVMRLLYISGQASFNELFNESGLERFEIVQIIRKLLSYKDAKKCKTLMESNNKNVRGKSHCMYKLTPIGIRKLVFLEYKYGLWELWKPNSNIAGNSNYYREMNSLLVKYNYFGVPPQDVLI